MSLPSFPRPLAGLCVLMLAACSDGAPAGPVGSTPEPEAAPPAGALAVLTCTAQVRPAVATCGEDGGAGGASLSRTIGGQGINVRLANTNIQYDSATQVFSMDVTVQNLLVQRMGTETGADTSGVYVFFYAGPAAANGTVEVRNEDGAGFFTSAGQPYFFWKDVLPLNAVTAPKRWEFTVPKQVANFQFKVFVQTRLLPVVVFDLSTGGNRDIWRVAADGSDLTRLTTHASDERNPGVGGRVAVFSSYRNGKADLYSVPLAGGAETQITATAGSAETDPALTPDGRKLAFVSDAAIGVGKVWTAAADGTGAAVAAPAGFGLDGAPDVSPAWAPTGDRLAFASTAGGTADVFTMTLGSMPQSRAAGANTAEVDPVWSPDGQYLAYSTNATGNGDLYLLRLADGQLTRLTTTTQTEAHPSWAPNGLLFYQFYPTGGGSQIRWLNPAAPVTGGTVPLPAGASPQRPTVVPF